MSLSLKTRPWRPKMIPRNSFRSSIASGWTWACLMEVLLKSSSFSPSMLSWANTLNDVAANNASRRNSRVICLSFVHRLPKDIPHFIDQPFVLQILVLHFSQLFEQLPLLSTQRRGRNHSHRDKEIAATASTQNGHSLAPESKHGAGLSSHRNFDFLLIIERLDHDLG